MKQLLNLSLRGVITSMLFMFFFSAAVQAAQAIGMRSSFGRCIDQSEGATPAMRECISRELNYQDSRIKKVYDRLLVSLDNAGQEQMRQTQQAWHETMMVYCNAGPELGQAQELNVYDCVLNETTKRAVILEYLERYPGRR
jgi:uncharacterized protein YecT (DUF1311 family)